MDTVEIVAREDGGIVRLFVPGIVWRTLVAASRIERMDKEIDIIFAAREMLTEQIMINLGLSVFDITEYRREFTEVEAESANALCDDVFWCGLSGGSGGSL